ncbi:hypothetical protein E4U43_005232 [Claviceps pusilla]|uniref:Uncharacterized protein n=1 Tax=Claviceps pusilla TaxID=123648 RepID=A0A9P7NGQ3_9HYPO|nr:hypothetical protein E4U43_005232 [Claviceps pusilla]
MHTHRSSAPTKAPRHQQLRSRDENQERAYIAASRRTDRSIEARLQSAHKASELHQKRTGKALRITEQIVFNDETYEEEDSWMPSRFLLGPQLQTSSADFNARVEAYLEQKIVMSTFVAATDRQQQNQRWGEIDRLFAESFPNAAQTARRLAEDLVPPTPLVLLDEGEQPQQPQQQQEEDKGIAMHDALDTTGYLDARMDLGMGMQEASLDETICLSDLTGDANGLSNESFFTADLPPEVLMFLGQDQQQGPDQAEKAYYNDSFTSSGDVHFSAFADTGSFGCVLPAELEAQADDADTQRPTGTADQPIWNDELDAYLDSSAWADFPEEEQAFR